MELFYRESGQGTPMIILHGLYGSSDNWLTFIKNLSENFRIYLPDLRNHGQSPHSDTHSFDAMRDDLIEFMKMHSIKEAIIVGHSMGGKVAMKFAASFPDLVKSLIIIDISPRRYDFVNDFTINQINHKVIISSMASLNPEQISTREEADKLLQKTIGSERIRQFLLKNLKRKHDGGYEWKLNLNSLHRNINNLFEGIERNEVKNVSYTVLFVKGELSDYIKEEDIKLIKEIYPKAEIEIISGSGHWVHSEKPEELKKVILNFLNKNLIT